MMTAPAARLALLLLLLCKPHAVDAAELLTTDIDLAAWVESPEPTVSHGLILAGDPASHRNALSAALAGHPDLSGLPFSDVVCTGDEGCPCAQLVSSVTLLLATSCAGLCVDPKHCEVPWTVIFVERAELVPTRQVNELLRLWKRERCEAVGVSVGCSRVLFALSTSFGAGLALAPDAGDLERASSRVRLEDTAQRELRATWNAGRILSQYRHWLDVVVGPPSQNTLRGFVKARDETDAWRRPSEGASTAVASLPRDVVDLSVIDNAGFVGQAEVVRRVRAALETVRAGAKTGGGPIVFFFVGPAGAGKTFLAQLVARAYSGGAELDTLESEGRYLFIDMGNYQDERAVDGFVDPSPGLQGVGILSELFERQTRTVVVLDEVEKAHASLLQRLLLPVLDTNDGHVTKKKTGRSFKTRDAIFILTSNCYDEVAEALPPSGSNAASYAKSVSSFRRVIFASGDDVKGCASAQRPQTNPFAPSSLQQRLRAGAEHVGAGSDGFFLFTPPETSDVERLVLIRLRAEHAAFVKRAKALRTAVNHDDKWWTGNHGETRSIQGRVTITGVYWTDEVLQMLQRRAIRRVMGRRDRRGKGGLHEGMRAVGGLVRAAIVGPVKETVSRRERAQVKQSDRNEDLVSSRGPSDEWCAVVLLMARRNDKNDVASNEVRGELLCDGENVAKDAFGEEQTRSSDDSSRTEVLTSGGGSVEDFTSHETCTNVNAGDGNCHGVVVDEGKTNGAGQSDLGGSDLAALALEEVGVASFHIV